MMVNIYLQANSMGLGVVSIGAFDDDKINAFLGVDSDKEIARKIQSRWNQLLPLAIHNAPYKKYREEMIQKHLSSK